MAKICDEKFLVIYQNFSYQIFLLAMGNMVPAIASSIFYLLNFLIANLSIFSLVKNLYRVV